MATAQGKRILKNAKKPYLCGQKTMTTPISYFSSLSDPRVDRTKDHLMEDIIFITIAAVICGAETWNEIEDYGKSKESWLRQRLQLPNGIPSHDTFNRFFSALDPQEFEQAFMSWVKDVVQLTDGEVVSIDGKTLCGSRSKGGKRNRIWTKKHAFQRE